MAELSLNITQWGKGTKRALLLHGLSSNAAGWWRFAPDLAALGFTVTAPDLRGHGLSPEADDYSLGAFASDLLALQQGWDLVVGHSLGGAVALTAAIEEPGWADLVVLEDPWLKMGDKEWTRAWLLQPYNGEVTAAGLQQERPRWARQDCVAKAEAIGQSEPGMVNGCIDHNEGFDLFPDLEMMAAPTLLMGAETESVVTPDMGTRAAAGNPAVTFQVIAGSGHSIHRDSYPQFREAVHRFILEA